MEAGHIFILYTSSSMAIPDLASGTDQQAARVLILHTAISQYTQRYSKMSHTPQQTSALSHPAYRPELPKMTKDPPYTMAIMTTAGLRVKQLVAEAIGVHHHSRNIEQGIGWSETIDAPGISSLYRSTRQKHTCFATARHTNSVCLMSGNLSSYI